MGRDSRDKTRTVSEGSTSITNFSCLRSCTIGETESARRQITKRECATNLEGKLHLAATDEEIGMDGGWKVIRDGEMERGGRRLEQDVVERKKSRGASK